MTTPAEALREAVEERWPGGLLREDERADDDTPPMLIDGAAAFWARAIEAGLATGLRTVLAGAIRTARSRRATALVSTGGQETPRSEREVPLIRALAAVLHAPAP